MIDSHRSAPVAPLLPVDFGEMGRMRDQLTKAAREPDQDLAIDCELLKQSEIFDAATYQAQAEIDGHDDAAEHYLLSGWRQGIEPSGHFDGAFLYPYFRSVGLDGPPALTYITLRAAGWPVYPTRDLALAVASMVRASSLFDADDYASRAGIAGLFDPALHYVLVGEHLGHAPSEQFDPVYYRERYPDVAAAGIGCLEHFLAVGSAEGRRRVSVASTVAFDRSRLDPNLETILLISHQASRTGAPLLAYNVAQRLARRYNVVTLLLAGGELVQDFQECSAAVIGPLTPTDWHPTEVDRLTERLTANYRFAYAIANTIDTRIMLKPLALALVPVVVLIHEFSSYVQPKGEMGRALEWATEIVFSAEIVADSALRDYPNLENRPIRILPQGETGWPQRETAALARDHQSIRAAMRPQGAENAFVVLGSGSIHLRKGPDIFLSCASAVAALASRRPVRFVWVGSVPPAEAYREYGIFVFDQLNRAGLQNSVTFLDEVVSLEPALASADLFFVSSRLDPLPNVAVEAASRGLPVVCFENATGFADVLKRDSSAARTVVPYLNVQAAASVIAKLADDDAEYEKVSRATRELAKTTFNMDDYVKRLDEAGRDAARKMAQRAKDLATIETDSMFDPFNFLDPGERPATREEAIRLFLARSAALGIGRRPTANFYYRRPCPGFHPQIYARENAANFDIAAVNPLAHFIRSGKPDGPWRHDVIRFADRKSPVAATRLKVVIQAHFHYPDLIDQFLKKLESNQSACDLILSTNSAKKADLLVTATSRYSRGNVTVWMTPNRGRNVGPFLVALRDGLLDGYDVVGHLHGKRSLFMDVAIGESWREFLWQNMLGGMCPMMDVILEHFAIDPGLGMVFPDDAHLSDWDHNRDIAEDFARRMGMKEELPPFFNFPIGTTFWARPEGLKPLLSLGLDWDDYPEEPVPIDGTALHAIERLLPFVAGHAGYRYATTHVPGITW